MSNIFFDRSGGSVYKIFVDQAGYGTHDEKTAVLSFPAERFRIEDGNGEIFFEGEVKHFGWDRASDDDVYTADFSGFTRPGSYRLCAGEASSAMFRVGEGVYGKLFRDAARVYYFMRCGCELEEKYAGKFRHGVCHDDLAEVYGVWEKRDVSGGWHDAGDYGRYVTAACCAVAQLLYAYKLFPGSLSGLGLDIPESGSDTPDILCECRYELEWLLKMQCEDGGVYHKVSTMTHAPMIMPEEDREKLFVFPVSSFATADFCAVCALAAGVYEPFDGEFSGRLKAAALLSCGWLEKNGLVGFSNPEGCNTGLYTEFDDKDNRFWACCEMFALTGEEKYHRRLRELYCDDYSFLALGYMMIGGLGVISYIFCGRPERDPGFLEALKTKLLGHAYWIKQLTAESGYGSSLRYGDHYWGSNMALLQNAMYLVTADRMTGEKIFRPYALKQLHVLLGTNPLGISYVTGCGEYCAKNPHYRPTCADGIEECIPGFVVGGPNSRLDDEAARSLIEKDAPPMKCYADDSRCYSLNEVTIYWNSPLVYVLSAVIGGEE